jgi:hypothetical protein
MRKLPTLLAFGFVIITLWRVGQFAESRMVAGWLGWLFAAFLGLALYVASYWTRDSISAREVIKDGKAVDKQDRRATNVKRWAWGVLFMLVIVDGLFNVAEVWQTVQPGVFGLLWIATAFYGAFPTLIVALLGALQGHIDRLPKPPKNEPKKSEQEAKSIRTALHTLALTAIENVTNRDKLREELAEATVRAKEVEDEAKRFKKLFEDESNERDALSLKLRDAEQRAGESEQMANDLQAENVGLNLELQRVSTLFIPDKRQRILNWRNSFPGLNNSAIAEITGASASYVSEVLPKSNGHHKTVAGER